MEISNRNIAVEYIQYIFLNVSGFTRLVTAIFILFFQSLCVAQDWIPYKAKNGLKGYVTESGKIIMPPEFLFLNFFSAKDLMALGVKDSILVLINRQKKVYPIRKLSNLRFEDDIFREKPDLIYKDNKNIKAYRYGRGGFYLDSLSGRIVMSDILYDRTHLLDGSESPFTRVNKDSRIQLYDQSLRIIPYPEAKKVYEIDKNKLLLKNKEGRLSLYTIRSKKVRPLDFSEAFFFDRQTQKGVFHRNVCLLKNTDSNVKGKKFYSIRDAGFKEIQSGYCNDIKLYSSFFVKDSLVINYKKKVLGSLKPGETIEEGTGVWLVHKGRSIRIVNADFKDMMPADYIKRINSHMYRQKIRYSVRYEESISVFDDSFETIFHRDSCSDIRSEYVKGRLFYIFTRPDGFEGLLDSEGKVLIPPDFIQIFPESYNKRFILTDRKDTRYFLNWSTLLDSTYRADPGLIHLNIEDKKTEIVYVDDEEEEYVLNNNNYLIAKKTFDGYTALTVKGKRYYQACCGKYCAVLDSNFQSIIPEGLACQRAESNYLYVIRKAEVNDYLTPFTLIDYDGFLVPLFSKAEYYAFETVAKCSDLLNKFPSKVDTCAWGIMDYEGNWIVPLEKQMQWENLGSDLFAVSDYYSGKRNYKTIYYVHNGETKKLEVQQCRYLFNNHFEVIQSHQDTLYSSVVDNKLNLLFPFRYSKIIGVHKRGYIVQSKDQDREQYFIVDSVGRHVQQLPIPNLAHYIAPFDLYLSETWDPSGKKIRLYHSDGSLWSQEVFKYFNYFDRKGYIQLYDTLARLSIIAPRSPIITPDPEAQQKYKSLNAMISAVLPEYFILGSSTRRGDSTIYHTHIVDKKGRWVADFTGAFDYSMRENFITKNIIRLYVPKEGYIFANIATGQYYSDQK